MWAAQILLVCLSATVALAAIGSCPTPKVQADFDLEKFAGTWYLLEASASVDRVGKRCNTYIIEKKERSHASLLHKYMSAVTEKWKSEYSDISTPKSKEPAKLSVTPLKGTILARKWDLWVIDTDYDSYAILYSCKKLVLAYTEEIFILSKTRTLEDSKKTQLYDILRKRDLNQKNLVTINQNEKDCKE